MPSPISATEYLTRTSTYLLMAVAILFLDLMTGPYLQFPILFVIPISMAAWFCRPMLAYSLATMLPMGRLAISLFVDIPSPPVYSVVNAAIRVVVLILIAYWICRSAAQTKDLKARISGFVTICAWSRTVEYRGEWISFEEYLKQRFNLDTSHGISPEEAKKVIDEFKVNTIAKAS